MIEKRIKIENLKYLKDLLPELNIEVETSCGYSKILTYGVTAKNTEYWTLETEKGKRLSVSNKHLFRTDLKLFKTLEELRNGIDHIKLQTKDGLESIKHITFNPHVYEDLVDIQVEGIGQYYANNILVHNSNILNSVTYGLYGTTFDTLKKEKNRDNKFINNNNQKDYSEVQLIIEINGEDVRNFTLQSLRDCIGVVAQDPHLFHESIAENLRYAKLDATEEEIIEACKSAQIWAMISALPNGLETMVGERGHRLSGGEKQRLAIARMMLKAPSIVILDEATAHLDSENEELVQAALKVALQGRTSIVIAHRLSTIMNADQILVMENGVIVERGRHAELMSATGLYSELFSRQDLTTN